MLSETNSDDSERRELLLELELERREAADRARRSLAEFVRQAWRHVLNPGRPLEWGWYLDAICLHLEAVKRRDPRVRRLLLTQPPNTLKSTLTMVCFPAWSWVDEPQLRFLCAASDGPLATRDALAHRDLVESDWYRSSFRPAWDLKVDQDQKTWFANTAGGHRISYSANARVIGRKGDILLCDDLNDAKKVHSQVERDSVSQWHDLAFSGRIADEKTSPHVVQGQRVHPDDEIGRKKKRGGWVELCLPEEFDPAGRRPMPLAELRDPRTHKGQWLRPTRFGPAERADAVARLMEEGYDGQHNQAPRESAGTWFDVGHLAGVLPCAPVGTVAVRYWDTAASTGETSCETAGVLMGRLPDGRYGVLDVVRGKWQPVDRNAAIKATAGGDKRRPGVRVAATWIEQEPGGSGLSDVQNIIRELAGFYVQAWKETGDKDVRLRPFAAQWQSRNVLMVEGDWNAAYLAQMRTLPGGKMRDMGDATAGAFNMLTAVPSGRPGLGLPGKGQGTLVDVNPDAFR